MDPRKLVLAAILLAAASVHGSAEAAETKAARAPGAHIGISKQLIFGGLSGGNPIVKARFRVANYGDQVISNISISEDLDAVYGAGNYTHLVDPNQLAGEGSLNYNAAFNGSGSNTSMISAGSSLAPDEYVIFEIWTRINNLTDQGFGFGVYRNQVVVNGTDPAMNPVSDVSTDGPNPDPDGNDDPTDNSVISEINLGNRSAIGVAKTAAVTGNLATFDLYLEAFGTSTLSSLSLPDDLDSVFGTGNYSIVTPPTLIADPGTLALNSAFDGSNDTDILSPASTLAVGATAQIRFQVAVLNVVNRGSGLGIYRNQATGLATLPNGVVVSDTSVSGTDPDPDGNNNPGDNASLTPVNMPPTAITGVAKTAGISGSQVTIDLYLENFGSATGSVSLVDDLDAVFGAGNYALISPPSFIDDPGTLTLNAAYNGGSQPNLLGPGSTLASGDTAQIRFVVDVTTISNAQGFGLGVYQNQARVTSVDPGGLSFTDASDEGTDPDPNGNSDPSGSNEDTPTTIAINGSGIGVALQSYVVGNQITLDYTIENLGSTTVGSLAASQSLLGVFGFGNFTVNGAPTLLEGPATILLNTSFDGLFSPSLINSPSSLPGHARARIRVVITVTNVTNQGNGFGVYLTQWSASGADIFGTPVSDVSDNGIVVDANSNGNAGDPGEDDQTLSIIGEESIVGVALQASIAGNAVTYDVFLENLGNVTLSNVSVLDDLDAVFGAGNYSIAATPAFIDDPGTLSLNAGFDGSGSPDLLAGGTLAAGDTAQIRVGVTIINASNVGLGLGVYANQVIAYGLGPSNTLAADLSDDGIDPDPNGNGIPSDGGESDPSIVSYSTSAIGVAKLATVNGAFITFDYVVENLGSFPLTEISLVEDLDSVFGAGNYQITTPLSLVSPPRELAPNPSFNGSGVIQMLAPGGRLGPTVVEQFRLVVQVLTPTDQGAGLGVYSNQVAISSFEGLSDLSDSGTDPDPNGNNFAGDAGEDDPTVFAIEAADVAISISDGVTTIVPGSGLTYTTVASNLNGATATSVVVSTTFDPVLAACTTTSVAAGGASGNDPGPVAGNFSDSGITLPAGATVTYTTNCGIPAGATGTLQSTAGITTAALDPVAANNSASDTDTLTPQSDLSITKTDGQASAIPGTPIAYTITVQASGPSDIPGVQVADNFPAALSGVSYTATATGGASGFTAAGNGSIADTVSLPAGSSITYVATATVRATATGSLSNSASVSVPTGVIDPVPGNNTATDTDTLTPQTDLAITKTDGSSSAVPGTEVIYTIVASNSGPSVATAASVADTFPAALSACSWTCLAGTGGSCTATGSGNIVDSVNLPVGVSATYIATCTVDPAASGTLVNTATVAAGAGATDPALGNNSATDTDTLVPSADLSVTLTDSPDPVVVGDTVSYVATVTNLGSSSAQDVNLSLPLPASTNFVSATSSGGASCTSPAVGSNGPVSCTWAGTTDPGAGASRSITVVAEIQLATPDQTILTATATAGSATVDPNGSNNSASTTTTVVSTADLSITLTASPDPVSAGTQLSYVATVSNDGPADAQDVTVTLPLPAGTTLASTNPGAGGSCNAISPVICTWTGPTPAAGARTVTIAVDTDPALLGPLTATATASTVTVDPQPGNDTATATVQVVASTDLSLTLADAPDPVTAGTQISYAAVVSNAGPSVATGVNLTMPVPAGTSFASGSVSGGGSCAGSPIVCSFAGSMAPGSSRNVTLLLDVAPSVLAGTVINATATVASATQDPVAANNTASTSTNVLASADLLLTLSASTTEVTLNVPVTFTATSLNQGPSDAQDVSTTLTLSPDFRYSSHVAASATCSTPQVGNSGAISCTWTGATAPGTSRILQVVAYSNVPGTSAVSASTTSSTPDPVANNNLSSVSVQVGFLIEEIPALGELGLLLLSVLAGLSGLMATSRRR
ncbi:MAG: hypothetical protein AB7E72_21940 [Lysobacterales bacterium]